MKSSPLGFWAGLGIASVCLSAQNPILAQIVPDATLPNNSIVTPSGNSLTIEGGTPAGSNLFHSFREFSVPTGTEAFFNNSLNIQNIFSRVTGSSISHIDGLIKANGTANLFLINPNGIIFGLNSKLNIGGSFFGSTASSIKFGDGIEFSAINHQNSPLLSINIPIGLQFGNNPGEIRVQGKGQEFGLNGTTESFDSSLNPLEVNPGNTLALIGGNVIIDGGILQAPGGLVELGGVAGGGTVGFNPDRSLSLPDDLARADISIINKAGINVLAASGGNIDITGRNLDISGDSLLSTGISTGKGSPEIMAGVISLNATEGIKIASSRIGNNVNIDATGNSGNINITTGQLSITNGAQLNASTYGQGNAGTMTINARDTVSLDGVGSNGLPSAAGSRVELGAVGQGGTVNITTGSLRITNGAVLGASTLAQGNAGTVTINARDTISLDGVGSNGFPSAIGSSVESGAVGKAGDINITTGSLSLTNGAQLNTSTLGQGNAGTVTINARDTVFLDGVGRVVSFVQPGAIGKGGSINIITGSLSLTNGGLLAASTFGQGDAGTVTINARDTVSLDGVGSNGLPSAAGSRVELSGVGQGGSVNIITGSLNVTNGAVLGASTLGQGDGGTVTINARDRVFFDGVGSNGFPSAAGSRVESGAVGKAGDINITTGSLSIANSAQLNASTFGQGNAGSVTINARDRVSLDSVGKAVSFVQPGALGNGGSINITTGSLSVTNGGLVAASTFGQGNAGTVTINARDRADFDGVGSNGLPSAAGSRVEPGAVGQGGSVNITTGFLNVTNGAVLGASTLGQGNGGRVIINARDRVAFDGVGSNGIPSAAGSTVESGAVGNGGNINITTGSLSIANGAVLTVSSQGNGSAGNIEVTSRDFLLNNNGNLIATSVTGSGGNIQLQTRNIQLRHQSTISAVSAPGSAEGNIDINTQTLVLLEGSQIRTDAFAPKGGSNIRITPANSFGLAVFQSQDSVISASGNTTLERDIQPQTSDIPKVEVVDPTRLVTQNCRSRGLEQNQLIVTGKGGLPPNPNEALNGNALWVDLRATAAQSAKGGELSITDRTSPRSTPQIVEAIGIAIAPDGKVILTANASTVTPPSLTHPSCYQ
ncbi:filamentous hemagglutinin N-terminal domain-containing protein [Argonema antarcticum]|uniref:two-partner secretion domain-containing protein n=1 Tax=Argonema antarcticum TaxID=2942763 RepID=UPI0020112813|nr:filamentous hemagglutinin N-terminal domain-containing protein [Argonema antarcticum]MCL1469918.1 filamentous hemagglutinin N-terminal domain-containing protein [Argonema antarcticum A004/B2]